MLVRTRQQMTLTWENAKIYRFVRCGSARRLPCCDARKPRRGARGRTRRPPLRLQSIKGGTMNQSDKNTLSRRSFLTGAAATAGLAAFAGLAGCAPQSTTGGAANAATASGASASGSASAGAMQTTDPAQAVWPVVEAVSYTHLDVYKRQEATRSRRGPSPVSFRRFSGLTVQWKPGCAKESRSPRCV